MVRFCLILDFVDWCFLQLGGDLICNNGEGDYTDIVIKFCKI